MAIRRAASIYEEVEQALRSDVEFWKKTTECAPDSNRFIEQ